MTYPITPPPELVQQWFDEARDTSLLTHKIEQLVAVRAAQWGADKELKACVTYVASCGKHVLSDSLRSARRPKSMSLKEQALEAVGRFSTNAHTRADQMAQDFDTIRRALESIND